MSFGSLPKTISVHLASPAFCPGEALDGEVHLQFPAVLDDRFKEIHIKLHGSINVYVQGWPRFAPAGVDLGMVVDVHAD